MTSQNPLKDVSQVFCFNEREYVRGKRLMPNKLNQSGNV